MFDWRGIGLLATTPPLSDIDPLRPDLTCAQVPKLAAEFFDWKGNGSLATADAGKVVDDLLKLDPRPEYDIIVHDVFSGVDI